MVALRSSLLPFSRRPEVLLPPRGKHHRLSRQIAALAAKASAFPTRCVRRLRNHSRRGRAPQRFQTSLGSATPSCIRSRRSSDWLQGEAGASEASGANPASFLRGELVRDAQRITQTLFELALQKNQLTSGLLAGDTQDLGRSNSWGLLRDDRHPAQYVGRIERRDVRSAQRKHQV